MSNSPTHFLTSCFSGHFYIVFPPSSRFHLNVAFCAHIPVSLQFQFWCASFTLPNYFSSNLLSLNNFSLIFQHCVPIIICIFWLRSIYLVTFFRSSFDVADEHSFYIIDLTFFGFHSSNRSRHTKTMSSQNIFNLTAVLKYYYDFYRRYFQKICRMCKSVFFNPLAKLRRSSWDKHLVKTYSGKYKHTQNILSKWTNIHSTFLCIHMKWIN